MFEKEPLSPLSRALALTGLVYLIALFARGVSVNYRRGIRTGRWDGDRWLLNLYDQTIFPLLSLAVGCLTLWLIWRYRKTSGRRWLSFDRLDYALTSIAALVMALIACCLPVAMWVF